MSFDNETDRIYSSQGLQAVTQQH